MHRFHLCAATVIIFQLLSIIAIAGRDCTVIQPGLIFNVTEARLTLSNCVWPGNATILVSFSRRATLFIDSPFVTQGLGGGFLVVPQPNGLLPTDCRLVVKNARYAQSASHLNAFSVIMGNTAALNAFRLLVENSVISASGSVASIFAAEATNCWISIHSSNVTLISVGAGNVGTFIGSNGKPLSNLSIRVSSVVLRMPCNGQCRAFSVAGNGGVASQLTIGLFSTTISASGQNVVVGAIEGFTSVVTALIHAERCTHSANTSSLASWCSIAASAQVVDVIIQQRENQVSIDVVFLGICLNQRLLFSVISPTARKLTISAIQVVAKAKSKAMPGCEDAFSVALAGAVSCNSLSVGHFNFDMCFLDVESEGRGSRGGRSVSASAGVAGKDNSLSMQVSEILISFRNGTLNAKSSASGLWGDSALSVLLGIGGDSGIAGRLLTVNKCQVFASDVVGTAWSEALPGNFPWVVSVVVGIGAADSNYLSASLYLVLTDSTLACCRCKLSSESPTPRSVAPVVSPQSVSSISVSSTQLLVFQSSLTSNGRCLFGGLPHSSNISVLRTVIASCVSLGPCDGCNVDAVTPTSPSGSVPYNGTENAWGLDSGVCNRLMSLAPSLRFVTLEGEYISTTKSASLLSLTESSRVSESLRSNHISLSLTMSVVSMSPTHSIAEGLESSSLQLSPTPSSNTLSILALERENSASLGRTKTVVPERQLRREPLAALLSLFMPKFIAKVMTSLVPIASTASAAVSPPSATKAPILAVLSRVPHCAFVTEDTEPSPFEFPIPASFGSSEFARYVGSAFATATILIGFPTLFTALFYPVASRVKGGRKLQSKVFANLATMTLGYFGPLTFKLPFLVLCHTNALSECIIAILCPAAILVLMIFLLWVVIRRLQVAVSVSRDEGSGGMRLENRSLDSVFLETFGSLFDSARSMAFHHRLLFFEDFTVAALLQALDGVRPEKDHTCRVTAGLMALICGLHATYLAVARPYWSSLELCLSIIGSLFVLTMALLAVVMVLDGESLGSVSIAFGYVASFNALYIFVQCGIFLIAALAKAHRKRFLDNRSQGRSGQADNVLDIPLLTQDLTLLNDPNPKDPTPTPRWVLENPLFTHTHTHKQEQGNNRVVETLRPGFPAET